ncbi:MAG: GNAT family N-acetyltransferase [Gemmatimonadota bacterium]
MTIPPIQTERLSLRVFLPEAIDALLSGNEERLATLSGVRFPTPLRPPPLMEDVLPMVRDRLRAFPQEAGWWSWLVVEERTARVVGALGFGGPPDADGAVMIGYATYPESDGRGIATEATRALVLWALAHPEVSRVCASVPPWNAASKRVAEKVGMRVLGTVWEEEIDDVLLYGIER